MFLDLDGFKPVNDTFGHPKGDAVLQAVAKRLCDQVGPDGNVGRMGGDEFAIVITDAQSRNKVEQLADGIINAIKEPYMIDQTEIRIGVSIGCAFGPIDGATVDDLILKADLALYEAKGALPVVLDDVLVNFDTDRQRCAARALRELSQTHQILAFTCHPHLAEVMVEAGAERVDLTVHQRSLFRYGT